MGIHAVEQLNAVQIIIEPFALAHQDTLVIHLLIAISNQVRRYRNAGVTTNVQHPKLASISYAVIHALKEIHASKMLSAEPFNITQHAFAPLDGPVIHKYNVTNVSTFYFGEFPSELHIFKMNFIR